MYYSELIRKTSFKLASVAYCQLGTEWNYKDVLSSYSRLFLITEGEAWVYIGSTKIKLEKGYLYLIPSFIPCSYLCPEYMEHYYAIFSINISDGLNLFHLYNTKYQVKASPFHCEIFKKLSEDNAGMALLTGDPEKYQKNLKMKSIKRQNIKDLLSSSGLLSILLAEFIDSPKMNFESEAHMKISESIKYIHAHISESLTLDELAKQTCMSADHYTKKFKELTEQTPIDYINRQRVEKAKLLIDTTLNKLTVISFQCGFSNSSYFCKVFKKYTQQSPRDYKKNNYNKFKHASLC